MKSPKVSLSKQGINESPKASLSKQALKKVIDKVFKVMYIYNDVI